MVWSLRARGLLRGVDAWSKRWGARIGVGSVAVVGLGVRMGMESGGSGAQILDALVSVVSHGEGESAVDRVGLFG